MAVSEFPSNRHKERATTTTQPPEKKVEKVVLTEVVRRKKPLGKRMKEVFVGGDTKGVLGFVALDVVVPGVKDMVYDAFMEGLQRAMFGESIRGRRALGRRGEPYTTYTNRYSGPGVGPIGGRPEPRPQMSRRGRASHNFDEIILASRAEATEVLERLFDLVEKYEQTTVADLYDLIGLEGSFTDEKWGWVDLRGSDVSRVRNGYLLNLPRPEPLE